MQICSCCFSSFSSLAPFSLNAFTMTKRESGLLAPSQLAANRSSLFSKENFEEEEKKKRDVLGSRSILSMAQRPTDSDPSLKQTKPKVLYENTYQLEPVRKFRSSEAKAIIQKVLETTLQSEKYDPDRSAYNTKLISQMIKDEVVELKYERYRIVVIASIGQVDDQGLQVSSRCVWDTNLDTSASGSFKNKSLFAVATVFAVYLE